MPGSTCYRGQTMVKSRYIDGLYKCGYSDVDDSSGETASERSVWYKMSRRMSKKKLPIGDDIFDKLIRQDFYYVDKTGLIAGETIVKEVRQELTNKKRCKVTIGQ